MPAWLSSVKAVAGWQQAAKSGVNEKRRDGLAAKWRRLAAIKATLSTASPRRKEATTVT